MPKVDRVQAPETPIAEDQNEPTMAGALRVVARFGLTADEAKRVLREVFILQAYFE